MATVQDSKSKFEAQRTLVTDMHCNKHCNRPWQWNCVAREQLGPKLISCQLLLFTPPFLWFTSKYFDTEKENIYSKYIAYPKTRRPTENMYKLTTLYDRL